MAKKREPEIRLNEALYLTKKELKPYWIYSDPLFASIPNDQGKLCLIPLDSEFGKKRTVLTFLDPTLLEADECLDVVKTWIHRYREEDLKFIIVMNCPFPTLLNQESVICTLKKHSLVCPTVIDPDQSIVKLFAITSFPSIILYDLSLPAPIIRTEASTNKDWVFEGETLIQKVLRDRDPGLPLEFVMKSKTSKILNKDEIIFTNIKNLNPKDFTIDNDHIIPRRNYSRIDLNGEKSNFILIARLKNPIDEKVRINIYMDDSPVFQQFGGEDFFRDDAGVSFTVISEPKLYQILQRVNHKNYKLTLEFPFAERIKVSLYSALFFNT
jgi:hypothetical protein